MLASVVGQDRAIRILRESLARGRLHHALLFTGPEGVGKRTAALALAARLLCRAGGEDACGECDACAQVAALSHPDLMLVDLPEKRKKILIEQVRELQAALGRRALAGGRKIAILDHGERLTTDAQNAFLKTLEEPPAGSVLVIVSTSAAALEPTVRSRCQQIAFTPLPEADVARLLTDVHEVEPEEASEVARYADGSLGTALLLRTEGLAESEAHLRTLLDELPAGDYRAVRKAADDVSTPTGVPLLLRVLRHRLREAASRGRLDEITRELDAARAAWQAGQDLDRYANRTLALETMWLRIARALGR